MYAIFIGWGIEMRRFRSGFIRSTDDRRSFHVGAECGFRFSNSGPLLRLTAFYKRSIMVQPFHPQFYQVWEKVSTQKSGWKYCTELIRYGAINRLFATLIGTIIALWLASELTHGGFIDCDFNRDGVKSISHPQPIYYNGLSSRLTCWCRQYKF